MKNILTFLFCFAFSSQLVAQERISGAGHTYLVDCNANGYVLTSKYPVSRQVGTVGANMHFVTRFETIYLGKSCDAFARNLGEGSWGWANGGFVVELQNARIAFARQDLDCPTPRPFEGNCRM